MKSIVLNKSGALIALLLVFAFVACTEKDKDTSTPAQTSTLTDIDGNTYQTVKIGNQWWMAEDLRVTHYRNGKNISFITRYDSASWRKATSGAYCVYDNDNNYTKTPKLYNWYVVTDTSNIAPAGWHIPTDEEWKQLEQSQGMNSAEANKLSWRGSHEGEKLKTYGYDAWSPSTGIFATNESGFSALANNCRLFNGAWGFPADLKSMGFWWSSTVNGSNDQPWYRYLDYQKAGVFRFYGSKNYGFSIRCVKD